MATSDHSIQAGRVAVEAMIRLLGQRNKIRKIPARDPTSLSKGIAALVQSAYSQFSRKAQTDTVQQSDRGTTRSPRTKRGACLGVEPFCGGASVCVTR